MRKTIDFLKKHPIITGAIGLAVAVAAIKVFPRDSIGTIALIRIVLTMAMSMFVYLISGEKSFKDCHTTTGYVVKWGILTLIPELLLLLGVVYALIAGELAAAPGWAIRVLLAVIATLFVGLFEELTFRVMIGDALLYGFRNNKHIFVWIAVISSFVFGVVHVLGPNMFAPQAITGTILKALSTGLGGLCWLILYWKTRNIWGIALIHALCDFGTFFQSAVSEGVANLGGAENYSEAGVLGNGLYLFQIVCSLVAVIILWKKVGKTIDFEEIRQTW